MRSILLASLLTSHFSLLSAGTVEVRTADELVAGLARTTVEDMTLLVAGPIRVRPMVVRAPGRVLEIRGISPEAALDWGPAEADEQAVPIANGLSVTAEGLRISNMTFRNFQGRGGCIKSQRTTWTTIQRCRFESIGTIVYLPLRVPTTQSSDTVYTQVVNGTTGVFRFINNDVDRCASNQQAWSHVIYVTAEQAGYITGNRFRRFGGLPLCLYGPNAWIVTGNVFEQTEASQRRYQEWRWPTLAWGARTQDIWIRNTVRDRWEAIFEGGYVPAYDYGNDYSAAWIAHGPTSQPAAAAGN